MIFLKELVLCLMSLSSACFITLLKINPCCVKENAPVIVRGLRAFTDFEYEFQRALLIKQIDPKLETVFIMTNAKYSFVSSSGVRELAAFGGPLKDLVPECVEERIRKHIAAKQG